MRGDSLAKMAGGAPPNHPKIYHITHVDNLAATDFRDPVVKEGKQAEFLMYESFPWELIEHIGTMDPGMKVQTEQAIRSAGHKPLVNVRRRWYY